jgi:spore coat polysaccharide biosynthesis protein SpsF
MADNVVISQARTGSTRLPNKVLLKILGKEILLHLIDRTLAAETVDHMIIATTDNSNDDVIVDLVKNYHKKVSIFRGSEEDVLDRYYQAALAVKGRFGDDMNIIRITSDCPLIDPRVIDLHVREFEKRNVDYLSSRITKRTWPHGMELEIFTFAALETAWRNAKTLYEREHVTPYIYQTNAKDFRLYEFALASDLSGLRFTLDYPEDFRFIETIYQNLYPEDPLFSMQSILNLLTNKPEIKLINADHSDARISVC